MLDGLKTLGIFSAECLDKYGRVKWRDTAPNVVTTQGKNHILDTILQKLAAVNTVAMGLHTTVGGVGSTYASPSPQVEVAAAVVAARIAPVFTTAAAAGVKSTVSAVSFSVISTATPASTPGVTGCFIVCGAAGVLTAVDTGTASAVLLSTGAFTGGVRPVVNGDTLNVTYSLTLT
jgi:hypothetical protein